MFRFFRRYQKTFIVVGGVVLIFVFTVGDSLTSWMRSREGAGDRRNPNTTAVTWDSGKLTEGELDSLRSQRSVVNRFVQMVYRAGLERAATAGREDLAPRVQPIGLINEQWTQDAFEAEVLLTHILAKRGEKLGIQISDAAVTEYINELGRGELGSDDIRGILSVLNPSGRAPTADMVYGALKHELLAAAVARSYGAGNSTQDMFSAELPINRWEQWKRVNDRIVIDAAAIDPATSLVDVPEPTDTQLREYYDKYKDRSNFPVNVAGIELPSSVPGFKVPRKVRVQYLRANYDEFVERYAAEVTDEQVAAYYEENKFRFVEADSFDDILGDDADESATAEDDGSEAESTESEEAGEPTADDASAEGSSDSGETDTAEESATEEAPAAEDSATDDEEAASEDAAEAGAEQPSGLAAVSSPFRLTAYQEPATGGDEEAVSTDSEASEAEDATADSSEADDSDSPMNSEADDTAEGSDEEEEVKYQPLEEVAEKIRRNIAEDRFFNEIDANMQSIVGRLNPSFNRYLNAKLDAEALEKDLPSAPDELLNLASVAKEFSLELEETGELDALELRESAVGKSVGDQKYNGTPVWQLMFANRDIDLYEPLLSADVGRFGDRYLVMKTADDPERVPAFEEIRDQIAEAWKLEEASKLALEKAKETAKKAQESGLSLKDFFVDKPEVKVTTTPTFTQFTEGDVAPTSGMPNYRLSQPSGVENAGPEFIQEVFKLKQGEATALLNYDHSIVYVVRLADEFESPEQLRSDFLEQANFWPGRFAFRNSGAQAARNAALGAMLENINVEWERDDEVAPVEDGADE